MENAKIKSTWEVLSAIDCNSHTEKKNNLTYLSWVWAWGIVKSNFFDANYEVTLFDGKPYLFDENLGYLVQTSVIIEGEKISMQLPVMDGANKAQKNKSYTYEVAEWVGGRKTGKTIEKKVEQATMFDINTAIMRCLTKNLAMFGLGHYIYAGEDLPQNLEDKSIQRQPEPTPKLLNIDKAVEEMLHVTDYIGISTVWDKYVAFKQNERFIAACKEMGVKYPRPQEKTTQTQPKEVDYTEHMAKIMNCSTVDELDTYYKSLSPVAQQALKDFTAEQKAELLLIQKINNNE